MYRVIHNTKSDVHKNRIFQHIRYIAKLSIVHYNYLHRLRYTVNAARYFFYAIYRYAMHSVIHK